MKCIFHTNQFAWAKRGRAGLSPIRRAAIRQWAAFRPFNIRTQQLSWFLWSHQCERTIDELPDAGEADRQHVLELPALRDVCPAAAPAHPIGSMSIKSLPGLSFW